MVVKTLEIGPEAKCPFCGEKYSVDRIATHCVRTAGHDGLETVFYDGKRYNCPFEDCVRKPISKGQFRRHLRNRHNASISTAYGMLEAENRFNDFQVSLRGETQ